MFELLERAHLFQPTTVCFFTRLEISVFGNLNQKTNGSSFSAQDIIRNLIAISHRSIKIATQTEFDQKIICKTSIKMGKTDRHAGYF